MQCTYPNIQAPILPHTPPHRQPPTPLVGRNSLPTFLQLCTFCFRGNVLELLDDIQELKPIMFCSVPRLWNRIYDRVTATIQASNPISRKLFEAAYASKKAALDRGDLTGGRMGAFWDKLVFSKIKARIGGEAPLTPWNQNTSHTLDSQQSSGLFAVTHAQAFGWCEKHTLAWVIAKECQSSTSENK